MSNIKTHKELPGLTFAGYWSHPSFDGGKPFPIYEIDEPEAGRKSINTVDGWNESCRKHNRRAFIAQFGKSPVDDLEVSRRIRSLCDRG
ncbi:MAG: hypothetical protein PHY23_06150 [Oscillospiraceae bacterium]|jgi:hypothetical protein|nr:hypothetical protein [Oscillospiraceae bacterium]